MKRIVMEKFDIDPAAIRRLADDFRDTWEFNFEVLNKWWKLSAENNRSVRKSDFLVFHDMTGATPTLKLDRLRCIVVVLLFSATVFRPYSGKDGYRSVRNEETKVLM